MALHLLLALLLATAAAPAPAVAMDYNGTHDGSNKTATSSRVLCTGEGCEPPPAQQALPIYGYYPSPPAVPSLPSAPPSPPSAPGSKTPCLPVTVVCCGAGGAGAGAGGQFPQQPNNYGPPADGYVPYHNASASPPLLLLPVTTGYCVMVIACVFLLWTLV